MKRFPYENHQVCEVCSLMFVILSLILTSAIAYASGDAEGGNAKAEWVDFAWRIFNFVILVGFLYWVGAKKAKEFFTGRRQGIKDSLAKAIAEKEEAENKFKDYSARIDKAAEEIHGIIEMINNQGMIEKEKIIEDAKIAAEKMKEDTKTRIEQEFNAAFSQLRTDAVQLSIQMAEEILKKSITPKHHEQMVKDYLDKVVQKH